MRSIAERTVPFLVLILAACQAPPPPVETAPVDESAVRAALEARIDAYEEASMVGDLATMKSLWTDDVHLFEPGMNMEGAEVAAFYDEVFGGGAQVQAIEIRTADVFVHGDAAYTIGDYEETVMMAPDAEPITVHNNWFARWELGADGTWRIDRMVVGAVDAPDGM